MSALDKARRFASIAELSKDDAQKKQAHAAIAQAWALVAIAEALGLETRSTVSESLDVLASRV